MSDEKKIEQKQRHDAAKTTGGRASSGSSPRQRGERRIECESAPLRQVYTDRNLRRAPTR
ncbi:MAG TPA: hypothetical protein VGO75_15565 [Gemmatimonadaceae bacterium]|nr:hypothetical protein [Gemmatimonadaceae bacterium]